MNISADKYHFIYETITINKNYKKLFYCSDT